MHNQTRTFCEIVRELGSLPNLQELGQTLISRLSEVVLDKQIAILLLNENRDLFFVVSDQDIITSRDPDHVNRVIEVVDKLTEPKLQSGSLHKRYSAIWFFQALGSASDCPYKGRRDGLWIPDD